MTTISGKIFIINFFLFLPYPIIAVYGLLSLLFSILRFHFILFFSIFSLIILLFSLFFYAFPPRYSDFQFVSRTFLIYLYIFLFDFSSFSYKSLFSYRFYIY